METQRPFVSSVTPLPALQSLLLFSSRVDTSEDASLMLFDHWLVVEMRGLDPALTGQKLLAVACGLRARLGALLSGALEEAERRKETGRLARAGNDGGTGGMSRRGGRGPGDKEEHRLGDEGLEDLPPMLTLARRAWFEGVSCRSEKERVKRDGHGGSQGDGGGGAVNHNDVDWAQEAEELSVELAEFMLQSIGYDVRSISPRQVESMLIDPLRMREPAAVRSILQGHVGSDIPGTFSAGKPDAEKSGAKSGREDGTRMDMTTSPSSLDGGRGEYDGDKADRARHGRRNLSRVGDEMETESERGQGSNKNIRSSNSDDGNDRTILVRLLAALSKAAEEEVRGSKGLFGLESGVLERLKGGVRVTPFLRHGSLRREASTGRAPHGLLADGGMKKWWRCPKCHVSQVVGLEDIHEHFKVCLVDPAPPHSSSSCSPANTDTSKTPNDPNPTATDTTSNAPKRTRLLVGTPFKSSGWTRRGGGVGSAGPRDGTKRAREDGSGGT